MSKKEEEVFQGAELSTMAKITTKENEQWDNKGHIIHELAIELIAARARNAKGNKRGAEEDGTSTPAEALNNMVAEEAKAQGLACIFAVKGEDSVSISIVGDSFEDAGLLTYLQEAVSRSLKFTIT